MRASGVLVGTERLLKNGKILSHEFDIGSTAVKIGFADVVKRVEGENFCTGGGSNGFGKILITLLDGENDGDMVVFDFIFEKSDGVGGSFSLFGTARKGGKVLKIVSINKIAQREAIGKN